MSNIFNTFENRFFQWLIALLEHIQISAIAILIAIFIAIPLAIIVKKQTKIKEIFLHSTAIFQTIPSLALLGLFIPFLGIGKVPAVVALVIYAIFPIFQNTITGFEQIEPSLEEAGEAFGMSEKEKLLTYQIPLAMPVIISGIRTTTVMVIGTATLAALIGAGGLGSFILLGIDRNNSSLILIGAISSGLLAIAFNVFLKLVSKLHLKKMFLVFISTYFLVALSFFDMPFSKSSQNKLIVAGKLGSEPEILMNMYKLLIEDNSDIKVEIKPNFGKTAFLYEALKSGEIDIYPEFSGTIVSALLKQKIEVNNDAKQVYTIAKDEIYKQDKLILLEPMLFQNTYAIALKENFAKKYNIENISDLKNIQNFIKAGFTLEFADRKDGAKGLKEIYDLNLQVLTMEPSLRYTAISKDEVQIIDAYSTDSEIKEYKLKILKDDKKLFPPYQGAPLMREETLNKYPELKDILNKLSGKISEDEMSNMNYEVKVNKKSAKSVAKEYLQKQNLIK